MSVTGSSQCEPSSAKFDTDTSVTVNILLLGGTTRTGIPPDDVTAEARAGLLNQGVTWPPIVWLASDRAAAVNDRRIVVTALDATMAAR